MTTEELLTSTFKTEGNNAVTPSLNTMNVVDVVPVSSFSSTCTRESDTGAFSDVKMSRGEQLHKALSDHMNAAVSSQKTSFQGKATQ